MSQKTSWYFFYSYYFTNKETEPYFIDPYPAPPLKKPAFNEGCGRYKIASLNQVGSEETQDLELTEFKI